MRFPYRVTFLLLIIVGVTVAFSYPRSESSRTVNAVLSEYTDLRMPSGLSPSEIDSSLRDTALYGLGRYFVEAEQTYRVNAAFLVSLAWLESGRGTSRIYRLKNNAFGFGAFDATPFESAYRFPSPGAGVMYVASYLSREYLSPSGKWFSGGYTVRHVGMRYSSDSAWSTKVIKISKQLFSESRF